jgi:hypothetical protein
MSCNTGSGTIFELPHISYWLCFFGITFAKLNMNRCLFDLCCSKLQSLCCPLLYTLLSKNLRTDIGEVTRAVCKEIRRQCIPVCDGNILVI